MKNKIFFLFLISFLTTSCFATTRTSTFLEYSHIDLSSKYSGNGGGIGWSLALPIDRENNFLKKTEIGFKMGFLGYSMNSNKRYDSLFGANFELNIGYRFFHDKMKVSFGSGYGYLADSYSVLDGIRFSTDLSYFFSNNIGLQLSYSRSNYTSTPNNDSFHANEFNTFILFMYWLFFNFIV